MYFVEFCIVERNYTVINQVVPLDSNVECIIFMNLCDSLRRTISQTLLWLLIHAVPLMTSIVSYPFLYWIYMVNIGDLIGQLVKFLIL